MKINGIIGVIALLALAGCGSEVSTEPSEPLCIGLMTKAELMASAEKVLVKKRFVIEKYDVDEGYIVTRPMRGSQFFEFFRGDNVGKENQRYSNIHSLERVVEITVDKASGQNCIECVAQMRRLSIPPNETVSSMSDAQGLYTGTESSQMGIYPDVEEDIAWIEMGRDNALENDILARIKLDITKVK